MSIIEDIKTNEEAFKFFEMTEEEILEINKNLVFNKYWETMEQRYKKEQKERMDYMKNIFNVPFGQTRKFYNELKKETQEKINDCNEIIRATEGNDNYLWATEFRDKMIEKKAKINFILKTPKNSIDIAKAKAYPIDMLLEFRGGFAKRCPVHSPDIDQETPSLKYYKSNNSCYCFVCNQKFDAIDICMKINNISLTEAVKKLC